MKLRIRGDTIRLRLKRAEVDRIAAGSPVVEVAHFPTSVLTYRLELSAENEFAADFNSGTLTVRLPKAEVTKWAGADQVSLHSEQRLADAGTLSVLIEKDFACLAPGHHRHDDDDEDTFPHPCAGTSE